MAEEHDSGIASIPITRTELVWPGKYTPDGTLREVPKVSLPFQVIERINETRATREARKQPQELSLFDVWEGTEGETFDDGWRNKLIWGDNLLVMSSLLEKFAGKIDLIYIDPPFATGADFSVEAQIGEGRIKLLKEQSIIEEMVYRDTWGRGIETYLQMMSDRLALMRELLSDSGTLVVHIDYRVTALMRLLLDELFGDDRLLNEAIWYYTNAGGRSKTSYARKHNTLLIYTKSQSYTFNWEEAGEKRVQDDSQFGSYFKTDEDGRMYQEVRTEKKTYRYYLDEPKIPDDVWQIQQMGQHDKTQRTGFPTQKPESLLERVVAVHSNPGDLVADFFVGSGTTSVVAEKLERRWLTCDLSKWAIHIARKRLLDIHEAKPFEVLNLGRYERQYWQGVMFGGDTTANEQALYRYLAFVLRLYGAEPVSGMAHLHGKKGDSMVHVGSVDAPVTIDEIAAAVDECSALRQASLHVLGWEWEMGLYELMVDEAKKKGVKLVLLEIPREIMEQQAADKADVQFFELAHLEFDVKRKERSVTVSLTDFVIPNAELIPEHVREMVTRWSDYIDYWAVDWDFQEDTFMQGWVVFRTQQNRSLDLKSDPHEYEVSGKYTIVVKVIDIFGNDTSQAYEVEVG